MKPATLILWALLLCGYLPCFSQSVVCDTLICSLEPISRISHIANFKYCLQMKMYLSVTALEGDTLKLGLTQKLPFPVFAPKNIEAVLLDDEQDEDDGWDIPIYLDKSQTLNIVLRKDHPDSFNLIVYYQIISPGLFYYISEQNYPSVFDFIGEEYFFYPKDVPIRALRVLKPDNMLVFKDLHNNYTGQSYVNLVFIEKDAFKQRESIRNENITMTVFVPDSLANDSAINAKLDKLYTRVNKIAAMTTTHRDINMLLINWRDEQRRVAAGKGFGNLFVCDIKFNPQSMLHETIHLLFDNKIDHSSGGGYFVGESVIEWLAAYFSDGLKGIDTKVIATNNEGNLYDIIANHDPTFRLVYTIGPAIIQKIAKQVGEERMAQALIAFLKETDDGQFRSYEDFILFMQHHLPKRAITRMDRMVRGFAK